jgi:ketosteroid isomerase-like protein
MYEVTFRGTNTGVVTLPDGTDVPATEKPFEIESVAVIRVEGDKIAEYRIYWDQLAAMAQLGMMPTG